MRFWRKKKDEIELKKSPVRFKVVTKRINIHLFENHTTVIMQDGTSFKAIRTDKISVVERTLYLSDGTHRDSWYEQIGKHAPDDYAVVRQERIDRFDNRYPNSLNFSFAPGACITFCNDDLSSHTVNASLIKEIISHSPVFLKTEEVEIDVLESIQ